MENIFEHVDMSYVSSGVLYERGFSFIALEPFRGELIDSSKSTLLSFSLAYASIASMTVGAAGTLPSPDYYRSRIDSIHPNSNVIPIAGIHQEYHKIDTLSIQNDQIYTVDDNLYDVFPRTGNPYIKHDLFLFAPATHQITNLNFSLMLDSNLFFTNTDKIIHEVEVDLDDDSGFVTFSFNELIAVRYSVDGRKNIKIRLTYTDNSVYYSHFDLFIKGSANRDVEIAYPSPDIVHHIDPTYVTDQPDQGRGGGTLNIYLACGHTRIEKPFIWAEGFNPIVGGINLGLSKEKALARLDDPLTLIGDKTLKTYLEEGGYDIILLDYDDGGDFLPRTAEFIKEAIRWVNIQKHSAGSNEKNVIMGQSMGGTCTNLALKEMEVVSNENHEVETFIIFDSPIMGANVPMCAQASLIDIALLPLYPESNPGAVLADYVAILEDGVELILLPGTRTMARYWLEDDFDSMEPYHLWEEYYNYQHNTLGGMPINCEILTIANGSIKGTDGKHNFEPEELIVQAEAGTLTVVSLLGGFIDDPTADVDVIDSETAYSMAFMAVWLTGFQNEIDIRMWASPDNGIDNMYYYSSIYVNTFWDILDGDFEPIIYNENVRYIDNIQGIDCAPGGFVGIGNQGLILENFDLGDLAPTVFKLQTWCFTPAVSVLNYHGAFTDNDFHDPFFNFENTQLHLQNDDTKGVDNYLANTPDVNFIGSTEDFKNTAHTYFTHENTLFMMYHMIGIDLMSGISVLNSGVTFNYGKAELTDEINFSSIAPRKTSNILDHSVTIDNTILGINMIGPIGLTPSPYSPPNVPGNTEMNTSFLLNIGNLCDNGDPIIVSIEDGSQFIVGDGDTRTGSVHVNNGHTIVVKNGGVLDLKEGSTLKLKADSQLIIESGGTVIIRDGSYLITDFGSNIIYHPGASLHLLGTNSVLEMEGKLNLLPDAKFKPLHDGIASGLIVVKNPQGLIIGGSNSSFEIVGDGPNDFMLAIMEGAKLNSDGNMELMRISNCTVALRSGLWNSLTSSVPFFSSNTNYDAQPNTTLTGHPKIYIYKKAQFTSCHFNDVSINAISYYPTSGNFIFIANSEFISTYAKNATQLSINGGNFNITTSEFTGFSAYSLKTDNLTSFSVVSNCDFVGDDFHFSQPLVDNSAVELRVSNSTFENAKYGVKKSYGKLTLRCNHFTDIFHSGVYAGINCWLEMSAQAGAGYNVFYNMLSWNITLDQALYIQLVGGYNYFNDNGTTYPRIFGTVQIGAGAKQYIHAKRNRWNVANTVPDQSVIDIHSSLSGNVITMTLIDPINAACASLDPGFPAGPTLPGNGHKLPNIQTSYFSDSIRLDSAIAVAYSLTELYDSTQNNFMAIQLYHEILMYPYEEKNKISNIYLDYAAYEMKRTIEHCFSTGSIRQEDNVGSFHQSVQLYVDVLNDRSQKNITEKRYNEQFYLEMDKVSLYRMIGYNEIGLEILLNTEACGLDSVEQAVVNHWKFVIEEEMIKLVIGPQYEGMDRIYTDTLRYYPPIPYSAEEYFFGTKIRSLNDIKFRTCESGGRGLISQSMEPSNSIFKLYPNPTHDGQINIEYILPAETSGQFIVFGIDGKIIYTFNCLEGSAYAVIDIPFVSRGIYTYTYLVEGAIIENGKFVIE